MSSFVVLVCGGRDFNDKELVFSVLDEIHSLEPIGLIVQGYAGRWLDGRLIGADRLADKWATVRKVPSTGDTYRITADMWRRQGKAAGYIRNALMLKEQRPEIVVAFPGDRGTANMCEIAMKGGVRTIQVFESGNIL